MYICIEMTFIRKHVGMFRYDAIYYYIARDQVLYEYGQIFKFLFLYKYKCIK